MAETLRYPLNIQEFFPGLPEDRPLRIVVLDTAASKTGALSVLRDYYSMVKDLKDGNKWFFITGVKGILEDGEDSGNISVILKEDVKQSRLKRLLFDHFSGKDFLNKLKPDVIISMQNTLPNGAEKIAKTVIYLHQPLGFQKVKKFSFFNKWERGLAVYQYLIAPEIDRSLKRADKIIVQTRWMKEAVCEKDGISPDKIEIMPPEVPDLSVICDTEEGEFVELCKPDTKLFIYPAGPILYKDHQCIVDAVQILYQRGIRDIKVIFTEKAENLPWVKVPDSISAMIEWRGMMSRSELAGLYKRSVLLFPSYIETFGLPLAEARKMGIAVIAADTPFAEEILSGYDRAEFFKVSDAEELAKRMERLSLIQM